METPYYVNNFLLHLFLKFEYVVYSTFNINTKQKNINTVIAGIMDTSNYGNPPIFWLKF